MKNIISIISFPLLLLACGNETKPERESTVNQPEDVIILSEEQGKNAGIETGEITVKNISSLLKVNGKIDVPPQSMFSVSVPTGGYLKSTKLLAGMPVRKGEILAVMEDMQYIQLQQDYLTAKAELSLIENEYNRQKELNRSKAISDKVFEQSKAGYETQLVLIKSLEEKLKLIGLSPQKLTVANISSGINIYSPITGFVSAVNVNAGKYVNSGDVLFELINPADIHLTLSVFEKDISKLSIGQKLFAYTNTNPGKKYPCKIMLINKNLSDQNSAEVHCSFEQYDELLLPGMFMNATIELADNRARALPSEAIVRFENREYVFIALGHNHYKMQEVQTVNTENNFTEIIVEDSLLNKAFVTKGAYNLLMAIKNKSEE